MGGGTHVGGARATARPPAASGSELEHGQQLDHLALVAARQLFHRHAMFEIDGQQNWVGRYRAVAVLVNLQFDLLACPHFRCHERGQSDVGRPLDFRVGAERLQIIETPTLQRLGVGRAENLRRGEADQRADRPRVVPFLWVKQMRFNSLII